MTTFPEEWTFTNGAGTAYQLQPNSQVRLISYEGCGIAPINVYEDQVPFQQGALWRGNHINSRSIGLFLATDTASYATMRSLLTTLSGIFNPVHEIGKLRVKRIDDSIREIECAYESGLEQSIPPDGFLSIAIPLRLRASKPDWYDPSSQTINFAGSGTGMTFPFTFPITFTTSADVGQTHQFTVNGSAKTPPVFVLNGPMISPTIYHVNSGRMLRFNGTIPSGATLTITMAEGNKTWTLSAYGTTYTQTPPLSSDSQFFELVPGSNSILITNNGPLPGGIATLSYYNRYIAL